MPCIQSMFIITPTPRVSRGDCPLRFRTCRKLPETCPLHDTGENKCMHELIVLAVGSGQRRPPSPAVIETVHPGLRARGRGRRPLTECQTFLFRFVRICNHSRPLCHYCVPLLISCACILLPSMISFRARTGGHREATTVAGSEARGARGARGVAGCSLAGCMSSDWLCGAWAQSGARRVRRHCRSVQRDIDSTRMQASICGGSRPGRCCWSRRKARRHDRRLEPAQTSRCGRRRPWRAPTRSVTARRSHDRPRRLLHATT